MARAQAESVIKNIIREIAQECAGKGQVVSETLVAFMVGEVFPLFLFTCFIVLSAYIYFLVYTSNCSQIT